MLFSLTPDFDMSDDISVFRFDFQGALDDSEWFIFDVSYGYYVYMRFGYNVKENLVDESIVKSYGTVKFIRIAANFET
jgi:hypothetical protein